MSAKKQIKLTDAIFNIVENAVDNQQIKTEMPKVIIGVTFENSHVIEMPAGLLADMVWQGINYMAEEIQYYEQKESEEELKANMRVAFLNGRIEAAKSLHDFLLTGKTPKAE